jgi:xanthine/uracil/vitamin C permease (AzgA family)
MSPDDLPMLLVTGIGAMLALLGFAALLLQMKYRASVDPAMPIDIASKDATTVKIPLLGEISTTYPALVFLFVGAALVLAALETPNRAGTVRWTITAHVDTDLPLDKMVGGRLALVPSSIHTEVDPLSRTITIQLDITKGKQFEDEVEQIGLTLLEASGYLSPKDELKAFDKSRRPTTGASRLIDMTEHTRNYQLALTKMPAPHPEDRS